MESNKTMKEFSAGAVIFRREQKDILFLLVYSGRNKVWGFPKGHIDCNEGEEAAAKREIKEETSLDGLVLLPGFREEDIYKAVSNRGEFNGQEIEKHTVYFLCETKESHLTVDGEEIADYKWMSIEEAQTILSFESLRKIIRKAGTYCYERKFD